MDIDNKEKRKEEVTVSFCVLLLYVVFCLFVCFTVLVSEGSVHEPIDTAV